MLVTRIFSFSQNIFYPLTEKFHHLSHIKVFHHSAKVFNLDQSMIMSFGKELIIDGYMGNGQSLGI